MTGPATTKLGTALGLIALAATLTGCNAADSGGDVQVTSSVSTPAPSTPGTPGATGTAGAGSAAARIPPFRSARTYREVAVPVRIRVPAARIDTRLQRVGLAKDGTISPPKGWTEAGWYDQGPRPGQQGPAVIVGHVDSRSGPAVFFRLAELRRGDAVLVERADGTTATFRVTGRRQFPKDAFPAEQVYSPTLRTSLILITCGGAFDSATGHYRDNVIVTAVPK